MAVLAIITTIFPPLLLLLLLLRYLHTTYKQYQRLSHIPGPFLSGISRYFFIKSTYENTLHTSCAQLCRTHGPLVRIDPNTLLTNDPALIRRMSAARSKYTKGEWYGLTALSVERHHIFSETDEERHTWLRARMASGYSGRELGNDYLERCVDERLLDLFALIQARYTSAGEKCRRVDMCRILQYFVVDVITDMAFREPFGMLREDGDVHSYISTQEKLLPVFEWFAALPWLAKLVKTPWIAKYAMPKPTDKDGIGYMLGVAKAKVDARFGAGKVVRDDMLGSFVKHGLDQKQCEIEAPLQVIAGTDTTVASLRAIVMYVLSNPRVYHRLQAELSDAVLSSPVMKDSEARALPYLNACIREGMRVFPPVTGLFNKRVPAGGDTIHGKFVPEGTEIAYAAWDFYKDPAVFGEDADLFRPERWLEASEEKNLEMGRCCDLVFGYGKYQCLGKPIAELELRKAVGEMFRRYDMSLIDPSKPWKYYNRNGFFFQSDMFVRISEREKPQTRLDPDPSFTMSH